MSGSNLYGSFDKPRNTRKIDTWRFSGVDMLGVGRKGLSLDVHITPDATFFITSDDISKEKLAGLSGPNLVDLKKQAEAICLAESELRAGIVWEDWLEITVKQSDGGSVSQEITGLAEISYQPIKKGIGADGKSYCVSGVGNRLIINFPTDTGIQRSVMVGGKKAETNLDMGIRSNADNRPANVQFSYIADTPYNREALNRIIDAIRDVGLLTERLLGKETINETLKTVNIAGEAPFTVGGLDRVKPRNKAWSRWRPAIPRSIRWWPIWWPRPMA